MIHLRIPFEVLKKNEIVSDCSEVAVADILYEKFERSSRNTCFINQIQDFPALRELGRCVQQFPEWIVRPCMIDTVVKRNIVYRLHVYGATVSSVFDFQDNGTIFIKACKRNSLIFKTMEPSLSRRANVTLSLAFAFLFNVNSYAGLEISGSL